eukprot:3655549-Prymnesium_polylepis.1
METRDLKFEVMQNMFKKANSNNTSSIAKARQVRGGTREQSGARRRHERLISPPKPEPAALVRAPAPRRAGRTRVPSGGGAEGRLCRPSVPRALLARPPPDG